MKHPTPRTNPALAALWTGLQPSTLVTLALSSTLLLGGCGGGGGSAGPAAEEPVASSGLAVSQPGELMGFVRQRLRERGPQGASTPTLTDMLFVATADAAAAPAAQPRSAPLSAEAGVDEADLIQSDGQRLFTLQPAGATGLSLQVHTRDAQARALPQGRLKLLPPAQATAIATDGMHIDTSGQALAVISRSWVPLGPPPGCSDICPTFAPNWVRSSVGVQRVDVASSAAPVLTDEITIDGQLVDSRRIGDLLYLVISNRPTLAPDLLPATATPAQREAAIAQLSPADVLPRLHRGKIVQPLLAETDCYLPKQNASPTVEVTVLSVFDLKSRTLAPRSRCIVGGSEALYMSAASLYLASTKSAYIAADGAALVYPAQISTEIHKFALAEGTVVYRGSGEVQGHLGWDAQRKPLRLSEHQGDLRVLSYTGQTGWFGAVDDSARSGTPSPARLTVLRETAGSTSGAAGSLQVVATLPNAARPAAIGKAGEQVHGVRFVGDRGYVVTFRRTDPLYVLDLSNPADPKAAGELEVPGYADYLFPLPQGLLLGVGRDADARGVVTGLKLSLLDVADAARPRQLNSITLGGSFSMSALDSSRTALNLLQVGNVVRGALPVALSEVASGGLGTTTWRNGLQRMEIDTAARTLRTLSLLPSAALSPYEALPSERSLQIGNSVYYLSMDTLGTSAW